MFKIAAITSIILFLSGCGVSTCLTAPGILKDEIRDILPTKPNNFGNSDFDKNKIANYWVKSDLKLKAGKKQQVRVTPVNVNLCHNAVQDVEVGKGSNAVRLKYPAVSHEKLVFRLKPSVIQSFDADTCDNKKDVYVQDPSVCKQNNINTQYSAKISNGNGPAINRFYNSEEGSKRWLNGKVHVLLNKIDSNGKLVSDLSVELLSELKPPCDLDKFAKSKCGKQDSQCIEDTKNIILNNDTYLLNAMCGNICGVKDANDNVNWSNCAQTEISIEHPDGVECTSVDEQGNSVEKKELTYIQSLRIDGYNSSNSSSKKSFSTYGDINSGICPGYGYEIDDKIDMLSLDLSSSNEQKQSGGYNITVEKDCSYHINESLYVYVSDQPPDKMPGKPKEGGIGKAINLQKISEKREDVMPDHFEVEGTGDVYYGVRDNGDGYENNIGYFEMLTFIDTSIPETISWLVNGVKEYIFKAFYGSNFDSKADINTNLNNGAVGTVYKEIINSNFLSITKATLLLYITLYSLFYLLGMFKASQPELLSLAVKIGIIIVLIRPDSWIFFNTYLFPLFTKAPIELIDIMTGQQSSSTDFKFLDLSLYRFTLPQTWLQILSLLFAGPVGWVVVVLILWGLTMLIGCLFEAVILYFISIIMVALLLSIAPIFIICILFQRTKAIFDSWIKILAQVSIQPVIVFASIALLNQAMVGVLYGLFNFDICSTCIIKPSIDLKIGKLDFCLLEFLLPYGFSPLSSVQDYFRDLDNGSSSFMGIPIPIVNIMMFVILAHAMRSFIHVAGTIASSIFGAMVADLSGVAHNAKESALGIIGMDQESRMRRLNEKYRQKFYSQGATSTGRGPIGSNANPIDGPIASPPSSFPDPTDQSQDE